MKELVVACVRVAQKDAHKVVDEQDKEYWRWRDNILHHEDLLLEAICFDLSLEPPYKTLFQLLSFFQEENNKKLRNSAWAFVNDSCLTMLCLLFSSKTIATSALYLAARHSGVAFPDDAGRPWWEVIGVSIRDIRKACDYMIDIYEGAPVKAGRESGLYERNANMEDDSKDRTRIITPAAETGQGSECGSISDGGRHILKRNRESDALRKGEPYANGGTKSVNEDADNDVQADQAGSPRKRRRVREEETLPTTDEAYPEQSAVKEGQDCNKSVAVDVPGSISSAPTCDTNGPGSGLEEPHESGLVSPKLGDASEEGEV